MTVSRRGGRLLTAVVRVSARRPVLTVVLGAALAIAALVYTVQALGFVTEHLSLLPQRAPYVVRLKEYQRQFGDLNDIITVAESPSPATSRDYATRLAEEVRQRLPAAQVRYRIDPAWIDQRGLLYLSVEELTALRDGLFDHEDFVASYAERPGLVGLLDGLNLQVATAIAGGFLDLGLGGGPAGDLRFLEAVLDQVVARLDGPAGYVSPWTAAFSLKQPGDEHAGWFFSADRRLLFIFVQPRREGGGFGVNRAAVQTIRSAIAALAPHFPTVRAGVTGGPAISSDEMATAFADSNVATLLALAATLGLLGLSFRRVAEPLLMLGTLTTSLAWSMGLVTLLVGHLNIFSVMFISIVVGIGIDYGIYFLYRYDEERALGAAPAAALELTAERTGPGILLGALAAAGTFFVLMLTEFRGIREFGLVSGIAILAAFVAMLTLFPALLMLAARRRDGRRAADARPPGGVPLEARSLQRLTTYRRTILGGAAAVTALAAWAGAGVDFDYNLLRLQAKGVESVVWEERILTEAGRSGFAALAAATSLDELRRKQRAFAALGSVSEVDSVLRLVPERQAEKIQLIQQLGPLLAPVRLGPAPSLELEQLRAPLSTLRRRLGLATEEAAEGQAVARVRAVRARVDEVLAKLGTASAGGYTRLQQLQAELADDFADRLRRFQHGLEPTPITPEDLPAGLRQRYVGADGRLLIRIHPAVDIWEYAGAARFIDDIRSVDPEVTGPPVTAFESIRLIRRGYFEGALYALALVALIAWVLLRSVRAVVLTLVPPVLGILWTVGLMPLFGLHFTLANVWAVPLIIGTAAEYGLNVFARFVEGHETGRPPLPRSGVLAVLFNGLTTIGGFASLMVASHQGIFGLGLLLTIGATASLVASLVVAPVLIQLFGRASRRSTPGSDRREHGAVAVPGIRSAGRDHDVCLPVEEQDQRDEQHRQGRQAARQTVDWRSQP
jgi:hopanoid biosynthesis associated RND transporter like protein HpnN